MRHTIAILALLLAATSSGAFARNPSGTTALRAGANHHLGDDSFVARFGRAPTTADGEPLRMRVHLEYVRDLLAARAATSPELEGRRTELLGHLDDYIAKGITPRNTYVARRNPVFIDRDGNICAVGYLIERSVGRALPETIAASHRLDYLEDIAAAMPEVASWVASSGFTLDELASIQPGYPGPDVMHVVGWVIESKDEDWQPPSGTALPDDGPYHLDDGGMRLAGKFSNKQMVGTWTRKLEGKLLGTGTFRRGAGTWKSFRADGTRLAEGPFVRSHAHGTWKIFFPSGRLAATGSMRNGQRDGVWTFFYDTQANPRLAVGRFAAGETIGGWKHFAESGKLVATAKGRAWTGLTLEIEPNASGIRHDIHQGLPADNARLDGFYAGNDRLYVNQLGEMFDDQGHSLEKTAAGWTSRSWSRERRAAAKHGDITTLHALMLRGRWSEGAPPPDVCEGAPVAVSARRAKRYDAMIASRGEIHAPIPTFAVAPEPIAQPTASDATTTEPEAVDPQVAAAGTDNPADLATYLADGMVWYIEWPHVDRTFVAVYQSLPGYTQRAD